MGPLRLAGRYTNYALLCDLPDLSADRNVGLGQRLAQTQANLAMVGHKEIEAVELRSDYRFIWSPEFKLVTWSQVCPISHLKRHPRS